MATLAATLALIGYLWLRGTLPQLEGEASVAGLKAPVDILRDDHGVPHVFAVSEADAYFGLGFVHGQDRLLQMDLQRRLASGRLAALVGEAAVASDRFYRTLGLARAAAANLANTDAGTRALLEAYAGGINAAIEAGRHPPEYLLLGGEPEPFAATDVLTYARLMAFNLSDNFRDELTRLRLTPLLPKLKIDRLMGNGGEGGSNNWAVASERSATGGALLANDPHLRLRAPGPFYLAHLSAPGLDAIGGTLPGLPAVVLGRNADLAWAFTTTHSDTQDLFFERVHPDDPARYLTPEGWVPFDAREEVIEVADGEPVTLTARATRHGPVISDVQRAPLPAGQALALSWPGLAGDDKVATAMLKVARAEDREGFEQALRGFHSPQQNILYADAVGNIGLIAPARVPIRASGDGRYPQPGWTGEADWTVYIPFEELPHRLNPAEGWLATANNRIVGDGYPHLLTADWKPPYRFERIAQLLDSADEHEVAGLAAMQRDEVSLMAAELLPLMLNTEPTSDLDRRALQLLQDWDHGMAAERPEPLIFKAWYRALQEAIYADEMGPVFEDARGHRPGFVASVLREDASWCDDVNTEPVEACAERLSLALGRAVAALAERYGDDPRAWRWGEAHKLVFAHPLSPALPAWARRLVDLSWPAGGDAFTVNVARAYGDGLTEFPATLGPTYRAVYDMAKPQASLFLQPTGQSGNPLSPHYRDMARLWRDGRMLPMLTERESIEAAGAKLLRLVPATG